MDVNEALRIAGLFNKFLETGDIKIIESISETEIRMALNKISPHDSHKQWYKAMEERLRELSENKKKVVEKKEKCKEKWFDRAVGFILGLLSGLLLRLFH